MARILFTHLAKLSLGPDGSKTEYVFCAGGAEGGEIRRVSIHDHKADTDPEDANPLPIRPKVSRRWTTGAYRWMYLFPSASIAGVTRLRVLGRRRDDSVVHQSGAVRDLTMKAAPTFQYPSGTTHTINANDLPVFTVYGQQDASILSVLLGALTPASPIYDDLEIPFWCAEFLTPAGTWTEDLVVTDTNNDARSVTVTRS